MNIPKVSKALATPLVTATSVVIVATGVLMFFHVDMGLNRLAHEWISMLFAIAISLHLWKNWNPLARLFTTKAGKSLMVLGLVVLALSFVEIDQKTEPAFIRVTHTLLDAPLDRSLPALGISSESFMRSMQDNDITVSSNDRSLREIALHNGMHPFQLLDLTLDVKKDR